MLIYHSIVDGFDSSQDGTSQFDPTSARPFSHMLDPFGLNALHGGSTYTASHRASKHASDVSLDNNQAPQSAPKLRVRTDLLFFNLAKVSVCLGRGPGFDRGQVDQAIRLSVIA